MYGISIFAYLILYLASQLSVESIYGQKGTGDIIYLQTPPIIRRILFPFSKRDAFPIPSLVGSATSLVSILFVFVSIVISSQLPKPDKYGFVLTVASLCINLFFLVIPVSMVANVVRKDISIKIKIFLLFLVISIWILLYALVLGEPINAQWCYIKEIIR